MNCQGLIRINTHSARQRVVMEPVCALIAQIPREFQVQLPLVCDLFHWMMSCPLLCLRLQCSCWFHHYFRSVLYLTLNY